jgi:hypothetical protein
MTDTKLAAEGVNAWLPIESAPRDGTPVIIWYPDWQEVCFGMRWIELSKGNAFFEPAPGFPGYTCVRTATHWMPMPEPPKD